MKHKGISTTRIAQICGVSQGTVDRALNNRSGISPKTKEKVLKIAKEYGYRPNIHARSMAGGKSGLIGVIVFDIYNQYFSDILINIESYCSSLGYSTVVMFTDKDHEKEIECIQNLYHMSVDGIVLCPVNNGEEYENFLLSLDIPIVTIGNRLNHIPYVGIDNAMAMKETIESVLEKGYKKLIYVKPELKQKNIFAQRERLDTFVEVCTKANIRYNVINPFEALHELEADVPCALICPTDIYAIKLLNIAQKHKVGIIGFDNIHLIDELGLILDSVSYDVSLTAKMAVDRIVEGIPIQDSIPYQIIKRGSI